jgi:hypothetical protein
MQTQSGDIYSRAACLTSKNESGHLEWVMNEDDIVKAIENMFVRILEEMDRFQNDGSSYKWNRTKHAVINMCPPKEDDPKCFAWVLLRVRYPAAQHKRREIK